MVILMRLLKLAVYLCAVFMLMPPAAAQPAPLPAPLINEQRGALPAELRDDPRASDGAIAFGYVAAFGCGSLFLAMNFAYIAPTDGITHVRLVVRQGTTIYMNHHGPISGPSGVIAYFLANDTTGGPTTGTLPMQGDTPTTVSVLLMSEDDKPLWYTDAIFDCDGVPTTTVRRSGPVTILNKNGSFDQAGTTAKAAKAWTFTNRATRDCVALPDDCAAKLKGKPGKVTSITQQKKRKTVDGEVGPETVGAIVAYDTVGAAGDLGLTLLLTSGEDEISLTGTIPLAANASGTSFSVGLGGEVVVPDFDRSMIIVRHEGNPAGMLFVRSVYTWVFAP
jgi:hypothetical protein